jgi:pimeloyl-ACP methyl ester carboxylesterase
MRRVLCSRIRSRPQSRCGTSRRRHSRTSSGCCATTSSATAKPRRRQAAMRSTRFWLMRSAFSMPFRSRKAHFAGLSMGGATALGRAEKHPDRFDRIIVCDSPCQSTPQSSQQWEERIVIAKDKGTEALVEPTIARWFPPETVAKNPPHLDKVRGMIRNTPANGFIGCAAALLCVGCRCGEASGSVHGGRERRRDACRHAQAQRKASGLAFCRTAWRRSHLQYGPAGGIHPRHYRLLELSAKYRLSVK